MLRNQLAAVAGAKRSTHRWTCLHYATAAFALRIALPPQKRSDTDKALLRKLENLRKRAKRLTIRRLGAQVYASGAIQWRRALNWIRFEVLPVKPIPSRIGPVLRNMRRGQYQTLVVFANEVISEKCTQPLPVGDISRFVKLAIAEIRRGRHPGFIVRQLAADPAAAKEFLFHFIKKRVERGGGELPLKFEHQSIDMQMSSRAEGMRIAMVIDSAPDPVPATPARATRPLAQTIQPIRDTQVTSNDDRNLMPQSVADWLKNNVDRSDWETVIEEAKYQLLHRPNHAQPVSAGKDIRKIQEQSRPEKQAADLPEFINLMVDWLLRWSTAFDRDIGQLMACFSHGLLIAKEIYKAPLDTRSGGRESMRYIGDVINGSVRA